MADMADAVPKKRRKEFMRFALAIPSSVLKAVAVTSLAAGAMFATVAPASAQTVKPLSGHAQQVSPKGACNGDTGPYVEVLTNYGTYYRVTSGPFVDDNGTSHTSTSSFTNTWSGTISATASASLNVSESTLIEGVSASLSVSATASMTVTGSHTVTYTLSPSTALHAEYAVFEANTYDESYTQNDACQHSEIAEGETYVPIGQGWHTWVTSY